MNWRVVGEVAKMSVGVGVGAVGEVTRKGSAGAGLEWMSKVAGAMDRSPARPAIGELRAGCRSLRGGEIAAGVGPCGSERQ